MSEKKHSEFKNQNNKSNSGFISYIKSAMDKIIRVRKNNLEIKINRAKSEDKQNHNSEKYDETTQTPAVKNPGPEDFSSLKWNKIDWIIITLIFIFAVSCGYLYVKKHFVTIYNIRGDALQHLYWMAKYHDPELFKNDIFAEYGQYLSPPGYQCILYFLTYFLPPMEAGKYLSIILFGFGGAFLYLIGRNYSGRFAGILTAFIFISNDYYFDRFEGGLHRAFMYPLLFLFIYLIAARKTKLYGWTLGIQTLIYPVSSTLSLIFLLFNMMIDRESAKGIIKSWVSIAGWGFLLVSIMITSEVKKNTKPDFLGKMVSKQEMLSDPVFYKNGRSPYFPTPSLLTMADEKIITNNKIQNTLFFLSSLFFFLLWLKAENSSRIWKPILALFIASVWLFELAKIFLFKLYIPDRYLEFTFPIISILLAGCGGSAVIMLFKSKPRRKAALLILMCAIFIPTQSKYLPKYFKKLEPFKNNQTMLFEKLKETSKDSLIAADPYLSDDISGFSLRKVLLKNELSHPWFKNYRKLTETRTADFYEGFYANDMETLTGFIKKYNINYIVCRKADLNLVKLHENNEPPHFTYEPLNTEIVKKFSLWSEKPFIISSLDKKYYFYENYKYFVIDCQKLTEDFKE